jgi:hypothetical protein
MQASEKPAHYRSLCSSISTAALTGTDGEHTWQALFAKATAIGGLPVPVAAIALPRPVSSCFLDLDSRNLNWLRLISFRLARTRAFARLQGRSPFEPMRRSRPRNGPDGGEGIGRTLIPDLDEKNLMTDHPYPVPPPSRAHRGGGSVRKSSPSSAMAGGRPGRAGAAAPSSSRPSSSLCVLCYVGRVEA